MLAPGVGDLLSDVCGGGEGEVGGGGGGEEGPKAKAFGCCILQAGDWMSPSSTPVIGCP